MVKYFLVRKNDEELIYEYFPENDREAKPGYIRIDRVKEKIEVIEEVEWERLATGLDCGYYPYASKAIKQIAEEYNEGNIREDGCVIWY